ncbi:MAG TPA: glycosyltransferase [Kineosporiaceae bacterium]|nr:glycosyltransferase [Kineosporiaceae bacterium]
MSSRRPDVSIVTSGHDVADARLHREAAALRRQGLAVEVHGLGDAAAAPPGCAVTVRPRGGLAARAARSVALPWRARGTVVITLDPDAALGAWAAARLRRRRLVADVHEDYAALLADRSWARGPAGVVARRLVGLADAAERRADLTVVADDHVPPRRARRRLVVRNLPDPAMLPAPATPDPAPRAVYVGDVRASRGLFTMLDALVAAPGWSLDVVGPVAAGDEPELQRRLAEPALEGRVRLHGRQPPQQAWALAAGAWVGLALLHDTPAFARALPSKLHEYVACGLPVLVSGLAPMRAFVEESGAGVAVPPSDGAAAGAVLAGWAADPQEHAALREKALLARSRAVDPYAAFAAAVAGLAGHPDPARPA